jgi:hypothetical protein
MNRGLGKAITEEIAYLEEQESLEVDNFLALEILNSKRMAVQIGLFEVKKQKRANIAVHMVLTYLCQTILVALSFHELFTNSNYY